MGIDKNLVQGSMALLLLRLLETKDMYGYEMIEALRSKSNNVFELKAGTLYTLLTENVTGNIAVNVFDQGLPYGR